MGEILGGALGFLAIFAVVLTGQAAEMVLGVATGALLGWLNFILIRMVVVKLVGAARGGREKLGVWGLLFPLKLVALAALVGISIKGLGASAMGFAGGLSAVFAGILGAMLYAVVSAGSRQLLDADDASGDPTVTQPHRAAHAEGG